jgi:hypothetical protein
VQYVQGIIAAAVVCDGMADELQLLPEHDDAACTRTDGPRRRRRGRVGVVGLGLSSSVGIGQRPWRQHPALGAKPSQPTEPEPSV